MTDVFEAYMKALGDFTPEELKQISSKAVARKVRRRQVLLQEGDICRHKMFVVKGLLRSYLLKEDGTEHILRFTAENAWMIEHESYNNQTPTRFNIDALEDAEMLLWTKEQFDALQESMPTLRAVSDRLRSGTFDASFERILMNISYTSEEKYQAFQDTFPEIFQRVPLHMVASYLGVSRETLSRIRHAQLKQPK